MLHERTITTPLINGSPVHPRQPDRQRNGVEYTHILVPTSLAPRDRSAIRLGLQMAAALQAKVSILHVLPPSPQLPSVHWLDAIDNLYQALSRPNRTKPGDVDAIVSSRNQLCAFLKREANLDIQGNANVNAECRIGDIPNEILRFADEAAVDLVILRCELTTGWSPSLSQRVRKILQTTQKQVVLLRSDACHRAASDEPMARLAADQGLS